MRLLRSMGPLELSLYLYPRIIAVHNLDPAEGFANPNGHLRMPPCERASFAKVEEGGVYIVDNGHIVGFDSSLTFKIKSAGGGLLGFMASGEGLVCEFQGQGRILIQTRNTGSLVSWLTPMLPP